MPRFQEKLQVKDRQSYMHVVVTYLTFPKNCITISKTSPDMPTVFHARLDGRFIEIMNNLRTNKLDRMNQGSKFLGSSFSNFSNRDNDVRAPNSIYIRKTIQVS